MNTFYSRQSLPLTRERFLSPLKANQNEFGRFLMSLADKYQENQDVDILLVRFSYLLDYSRNDLAKLLEFANEQYDANEAQIEFVDKYRGEVFEDTWDRHYQEQNQVLIQKIIPYLKQLIEGKA